MFHFFKKQQSFGTETCACPHTSRRRLHPEDRPVILLVSNKSFSSWARCAFANRMICAHGAICARSLECEHSDSASLDYVASGSDGRAGPSSRPKGAPTTKRGNHKGCLYHLGLDSRANCALGLPRSRTSTGSSLCSASPSSPC